MYATHVFFFFLLLTLTAAWRARRDMMPRLGRISEGAHEPDSPGVVWVVPAFEIEPGVRTNRSPFLGHAAPTCRGRLRVRVRSCVCVLCGAGAIAGLEEGAGGDVRPGPDTAGARGQVGPCPRAHQLHRVDEQLRALRDHLPARVRALHDGPTRLRAPVRCHAPPPPLPLFCD
jgi:hypothetical protein